ncbi:hypothetical protein BDQ12DRAFT_666811 [Crucibulum laeve]|uniref:pyranose dehydrogenase (acceptor) n=1 Tax=Crucibulum laeve TaxID=68775 RepID=A0A5C3LYP1_9AGAR|nr:hypothetical protein BDQ12DRAFT_666811 [Crucibulum laeve]
MAPISNAMDFSTIKFDYLIIGGGVGGLTLAARLSEDPNVVVGVVEAGKHITDMPEINIPGNRLPLPTIRYVGKALGNPEIDWNFFTVPQAALQGRPIFQPRGKVLGGSSAINFMSLSRATRDEYDAIEKLGNLGWNWEGLLPYFKKMETIAFPPEEDVSKYNLKRESSIHGTDGPVPNSFPIWYPDLHISFLETMEALGVKVNPDPQNGQNVGAFTGSYTIDPQTASRSYAATIHYEANKERSNLHVLTEAHVTKILSKHGDDTVIVTGMTFMCLGKSYTVEAKREISLCAGTPFNTLNFTNCSFQTPQLLELSGIGNPQILEKFGIETVVDLPAVGENLQVGSLCHPKDRTNFSLISQDHPYVPVIQEVTDKTQTFEILEDSTVLGEQAALYMNEKKGMFSSVHPGTPGELSPVKGTRYQTLLAILLHPFSRGSVHISSADPLVPPTIDPNYLAHPVEVEIMVEAVKYSRKVMAQAPLGEHRVKYSQLGPNAKTDEDIKNWVLKYLGSTWHPLGTASMLPKAEGGVVDSDLIVYGTSDLRVVDASIFPLELSCHLQANVYALAEKAAELIRQA